MEQNESAISLQPQLHRIPNRPRVHITLQGKGGVGKSLVAVLLAQYLRSTRVALQCVDTDPMNDTMAQFKALNATHLDIVREGRFDDGAYDELMGQILAKRCSFVVDCGAASFVALTSYFAESDSLELLRAEGRDILFHTVITGGQAMRDTLIGLKILLETTRGSGIVVWLNEYFGPIEAEVATNGQIVKKCFTQMKIFEENRDAILGVVTIARRNPDTFGRDIRSMLSQKLTFEEIRQSADWALISRSRLFRVEQDLYAQLEPILG